MNVTFDRKFFKDFSKLPEHIQKSFAELHEVFFEVSTIRDIPNCLKLAGNENIYRVRIGDYRITFKSKDTNSIEFRRFLSRGQVYKKHISKK